MATIQKEVEHPFEHGSDLPIGFYNDSFQEVAIMLSMANMGAKLPVALTLMIAFGSGQVTF